MNALSLRWIHDDLFKSVKDFVLGCREFHNLSKEERIDWYKNYAPKLPHNYFLNSDNLDLRYIDLSNCIFKDTWLDYIMDYANFSECQFHGVFFQSGCAMYADFHYANFVSSQMTPFFAKCSNFEGSTFEKCLMFGAGAETKNINKLKQFSDFSECDFSKSKMRDVCADSCNFTRSRFVGIEYISSKFNYSLFNFSDFSNANFESCSFRGHPSENEERYSDTQVDFRGCNFKNVSFKECDFLNAKFDDTPLARAVVSVGNNYNVDTIFWCPVHATK